MIKIDETNPKQDIQKFIWSWFELLSKGQLDIAISELDEPNIYQNKWTGEEIMNIINDTFGPNSKFRQDHPDGPMFTSPYALKSSLEPGILETHYGYDVDCDVPLNGEVSDLTAQFEFHRRDDRFAVVLHDLHVL